MQEDTLEFWKYQAIQLGISRQAYIEREEIWKTLARDASALVKATDGNADLIDVREAITQHIRDIRDAYQAEINRLVPN